MSMKGCVQILCKGREGGHQKDHKRSHGGRVVSPKDHRGSQSQGGGGGVQKFAKLKGLKKEITTPSIRY